MFGFLFFVPFILFFLVFGLILFRIFSTWSSDNKSPRLSVDATVVAKRGHTTYHNSTGTMHGTHSTRYYATFQFESGDRLELVIPRNQIGYLIEGDRGRLTFQGTRFLGFERR